MYRIYDCFLQATLIVLILVDKVAAPPAAPVAVGTLGTYLCTSMSSVD